MQDNSINTQLDERTDLQVATDALDACILESQGARKAIWFGCIKLRTYEFLPLYKAEILKATPAHISSIERFSEIEQCTNNLLSSYNARSALTEMVYICISILDIACFCKLDFVPSHFPRNVYGLSKCLQFVMSKCF